MLFFGTVDRGFKSWPLARPQLHQCLLICLMATSMWVRKAWLPCCTHAYTVYTSIGGKGRCCTRHYLWDHCMQARKSTGEKFALDLKPMRKGTQSPKQAESVAPKMGLGPRTKI